MDCRPVATHAHDGPAADDSGGRATWWEPLTLLGSTLWWVERFVRSTEARDAGKRDPAVPKDPAYYLEQALVRLERLEHELDAR